MPRVYDCLLAGDDPDLLEARFRALENIPGLTHVLAETPVDHQGNPRPMVFWEGRKDRFGRWHGRWTHVRVEAHELPRDATPEQYDDALRGWLAHAAGAEPDAVVLYGEAGEIPDAGVIAGLAAGNRPA